jgi:ANTAR domain
MIPGPRPSQGHARPSTDGDGAWPVPVSLTRTARGWAVHSPSGVEEARDLVEGLSLADLVAEELGALTEPDRTARRSARGPAEVEDDGTDARIAALERTVAQLEHALAARVSTERAIGVLAERHGTSARAAFESLRGEARSQGRPVAELAREVLAGLPGAEPDTDHREPPRSVAAEARPRGSVVAAVTPPPRKPTGSRTVATADGRS